MPPKGSLRVLLKPDDVPNGLGLRTLLITHIEYGCWRCPQGGQAPINSLVNTPPLTCRGSPHARQADSCIVYTLTPGILNPWENCQLSPLLLSCFHMEEPTVGATGRRPGAPSASVSLPEDYHPLTSRLRAERFPNGAP
jgi:hypothetical protein